MPDYKAMYFRLAGKVANAVELLVQAQLEGEDAALDDARASLVVHTDSLEEES